MSVRRRRTRARWWVALGSIATSICALEGCFECTEVGCLGAITVGITPSDGEVFGPSSEWVIDATTASMTFSCTLRTDAMGASRVDSGCDLPVAFVDSTGSTGLRLFVPLDETAAAAGTLTLRVVEAGRTLVEETDLPLSIETSQPNGPHCPPTCLEADVALRARPR